MAVEQERPLFQTNIRLNVAGEKVTKGQQAILNVLSDAEKAMKQRLENVTVRDLMNTVTS
jgi:DNA-binding IscR family transcriptional regulator